MNKLEELKNQIKELLKKNDITNKEAFSIYESLSQELIDARHTLYRNTVDEFEASKY